MSKKDLANAIKAARQIELNGRGSGATTRAMQAAPIGAVYVWCNDQLQYPKELAQRLGRKDLKIVSASWLTDRHYAKAKLTAVIKDHAAEFTWLQWERYFDLKSRTKL